MTFHVQFLLLSVLPSFCLAEDGPAMNVPSNAIFYAELDDFSRLRKALAETPVGSLVFSDKPAVSVSMLMGIGKLFLRSVTGVDMEEWGLHLSGQAGLAIFNPQQLGVKDKDPPLVLLCRVKSDAGDFRAFYDGIRESVLANAPHLQHEGVDIGNNRLDVFVDSRNQKTFSTTFANGYFMFGGRRAIRAALETQTRLSDTALFKRAQQLRDEGAQFWSLFDVQQASKTMLAAQQDNEKKMREIQIAGLPSLAGIFTSTRFENGTARERVVWMRSDAEPLGFALAFTRPRPRQLKGATIVPADYALFVNGHLESGKDFIQAVIESIGEILGEEHVIKFDEGKAWLEDKFKLNLEQDVFGNLTGEVVYALHLPDMEEQLLQTAELTKPKEWDQFLALSINNMGVARGVIKSFLDSDFAAQQGFFYEIEEAAGFDVFSVRQKKNKFAIGLTGGFVVFSQKLDVVANVLRSHQEGTTMDRVPDLKNQLKRTQDGHNLVSRVGIDWFTRTAVNVLEKFAHPPVAMAMKEFRPGLEKLTPGIITARNTSRGFEFEVNSSQGILIHFLGVAALVNAVKKSPGAKVIRARRQLDELAEAIDKYFIGNGSFPPSLDALAPKYVDRIRNDPFGGGKYHYYPGPKTVEGGRELYLKNWFLLSRGPDGKQDISYDNLNLAQFQKRLVSEDPADLRYMRQVTYQFRPEKNRLEARLLDRGDIYVWGLAPK